MKTTTLMIVAGGLALATLPSVFAGDAGAKFKDMDANGDGRVTRAEYAAGQQAKFAKLDTNADGAISPEEVSAGLQKKTSKLKFWAKDDNASGTEMLSAFDQNTDGQITRAEFESGAEARFAGLDTDKDGALTEQELEAGHSGQQPMQSPSPLPQDR